MQNEFKIGDKVAFDYEPQMCMTVVAVHDNGTMAVQWGDMRILNYPQDRFIFSEAIYCNKRVNPIGINSVRK